MGPKRGVKVSNTGLVQAPVSASGIDSGGVGTYTPSISDTTPPEVSIQTNEDLEAKWEARLKLMEARQLATEERLKTSLAENEKLAMKPPQPNSSVRNVKNQKDYMPEAKTISARSRCLFEDSRGNIVPRERLIIGQTMRRTLLATPHFKGVDLRTPHVHVYVDNDTRVSVYDHLHILSVLMHVIQVRKMTQKNVNPNVSKYCLYLLFLSLHLLIFTRE